jgi:hypothetical protein
LPDEPREDRNIGPGGLPDLKAHSTVTWVRSFEVVFGLASYTG